GAQLEGAGNLRHVILGGAELEQRLRAISAIDPPEATRADDPAYLVYTSGTTGYPKGVLHAHRSLIGRAPASRYWFDFRGREAPAESDRGREAPPESNVDRIMHSGKFNWTYVLGSALMDPLYRGKTVIAHEGRNDASTWPRLIA